MCPFESSLCGYSMTVGGATYSWMRSTGYATQRTMAPAVDVSGNPQGTFVYASGPGGQRMNSPAKMMSPTFSRSATNCRVQVRRFNKQFLFVDCH